MKYYKSKLYTRVYLGILKLAISFSQLTWMDAYARYLCIRITSNKIIPGVKAHLKMLSEQAPTRAGVSLDKEPVRFTVSAGDSTKWKDLYRFSSPIAEYLWMVRVYLTKNSELFRDFISLFVFTPGFFHTYTDMIDTSRIFKRFTHIIPDILFYVLPLWVFYPLWTVFILLLRLCRFFLKLPLVFIQYTLIIFILRFTPPTPIGQSLKIFGAFTYNTAAAFDLVGFLLLLMDIIFLIVDKIVYFVEYLSIHVCRLWIFFVLPAIGLNSYPVISRFFGLSLRLLLCSFLYLYNI